MISRPTDKNKITKYNIRTPMTAKKAFTIVELLVVIVVIAILAIITVVVYRGVTDSARNSVVVANLDQANKSLNVYKETSSNNGYPNSLSDAHVTLNNDSNATYNYYVSSDNTNYCLQATVNSKVQSIAGNNQAISNSSCVVATNLITNGDFSQGTSGWNVSPYILGTVASNELAVYSSIVNGEGGIQSLGHTLLANHKYYAASYIKANSNKVKFQISNGTTYASNQYSSGSGNYERLSAFYTYGTTYDSGLIGARTTISEIYYMKYVIFIDLTSAFGAGNEPTTAQMDTILQKFPNSWFNGTNVIQVPASQ